MRYAITIQSSRSQQCGRKPARARLRLLTCLVCLHFVLPCVTQAQTTAPAPLPPDAQAAMKKGIIAAKEQEWLIAIQSFQEARKAAPEAPVVFYNLGLAESKIPGRELRAVAWFGAYLTANPNAPNVAAVNDFITALQIKNHGNINRLITMVQDAASKLPDNVNNVLDIPHLWARAGDFAVALKTTNLIKDAHLKSIALLRIGEVQAEGGDISGAQKTWASALETANLSQTSYEKDEAQSSVAKAQAGAGDVAGALRTAEAILNPYDRSFTQVAVANAQTKAGDITGAKMTLALALKTADLIQGTAAQSNAEFDIGEAQTKAGDTQGAQRTLAAAVKSANLEDAEMKDGKLPGIARAQAEAGDITGALKTADLIRDPLMKDYALRSIAATQAGTGDVVGGLKTADLIRDAARRNEAVEISKTLYDLHKGSTDRLPTVSQSATPPAVAIIRISDWLEKLDDGSNENIGECALNTEPFLNLAGYLKSLPTSDKPQTIFEDLRDTAGKRIRAQNVINKMLKQQAKK